MEKISPIVPKEQWAADNKHRETKEADSADLWNGTFLLLKRFLLEKLPSW